MVRKRLGLGPLHPMLLWATRPTPETLKFNVPRPTVVALTLLSAVTYYPSRLRAKALRSLIVLGRVATRFRRLPQVPLRPLSSSPVRLGPTLKLALWVNTPSTSLLSTLTPSRTCYTVNGTLLELNVAPYVKIPRQMSLANALLRLNTNEARRCTCRILTR